MHLGAVMNIFTCTHINPKNKTGNNNIYANDFLFQVIQKKQFNIDSLYGANL